MSDSPEKNPEIPQLTKGRKFRRGCAIFFRWVFIILFAIILLGGLYFKAPWKVLALGTILLALLTVVPKAYRKYGWLTLAAAVLAVTVWIFLPGKNAGNWKPYSFDKEINTLKVKYAVPDEENAAIIIEEMLGKYDELSYKWPDFSKIDYSNDPNFSEVMKQVDLTEKDFYPDWWTNELDTLTLNEPWGSEDHPELAQWLNQYNSAIDMLIEASHKPKYRFNYTFNIMEDSLNDPFLTLSDWIRLLKRSANNDWGNGRPDQTIEKYATLFRLSKLFSDQPDATLIIFRHHIYRFLHTPVSRFIVENKLSESQLNALEKAIEYESHDLKLIIAKCLEHEKLSTKQLYAMTYEINDNEETRFSRTCENEFAEKMNIQIPKRRFEAQWIKLGSVVSWFWMPTTPQELAKQIDNVYSSISDIPIEEFDNNFKNQEFEMNFRYVIESFSNLTTLKSCQILYQIRNIRKFYYNAYRTYIALRKCKNKYGFWPDTLDQLTEFTTEDTFCDPLNNDTLVYQKNGEDFKLYSKGKNGIDEGGSCEDEADDMLLWPEELEESTKIE